ncbi:MAG: protein kinase [Gemmatimonadaceae bacterium]
MSLTPGARLGPYEVTAQIGVGGMGEVYRATDTSLKRQVAIKVLPAAVAADADRLARFQREAEVLAALNHPNIAHIHGLEKSGGTFALVMELVEGPTLADRIAQGAIPIEEALPIAKQIAEALEAAHEQGIIHRDLKPANIKVREDGTVKVLDFGLAKAMDPASAASENAMNSPTITAATLHGVILGTAAYMSPEQAAGKALDKRSDLWAFGVVLLEMLTGRQVFGGETVSHVLASVLKDTPDLAALPADTPAPIRKLLRRCLEKDRRKRLADAADAGLEIDDVLMTHAADAWETTKPDRGGTVSRSGSHDSPAHSPDIALRTFALSAEVCRKLDRSTLDPRIIGDHLQYADNGIASDTLVCFLHGTGLDYGQFEHLLRRVPYRAVAPTLYGCEPHARRRLRLSVTDHLIIVREWLRHLVQNSAARRVVLVGFSTGGDLWLRFVSPPVHDPAIRVDAILALDANVSLETCWFTRVLARLTIDEPSQVLDNFRAVGAGTGSVREWLNIHEYFVKVLRKFQGDIDVLAKWGAEFAGPFEGGGLAEFAERYRTATRVVPHVRFVVSEQNDANREAVLKARLMNLDTGLLGERYTEGSIVIEPDADHFDLLQPSRLLPHLESLVADARRAP